MLDRLPVELLQHILRLAAPLEYHPSTYKGRRRLLRTCCLVSRAVRAVAQPMLPEVFHTREAWCDGNGRVLQEQVEVDSDSDSDRDRDSDSEEERVPEARPEGVKHLVALGCESECRLDKRLVVNSLVSVVLGARAREEPGLSLSELTAAPALRRLVFIGFALYSRDDMVFPNLVEISFLGCTGNIDFYSSTLYVDHFPRIRAVAITFDCYGLQTWSERGSSHILSTDHEFLQQLDILVLDSGDIHPADIPRLGGVPTLLEVTTQALVHFEAEPVPLPPAMRLYCSADVAATSASSTASSIAEELSAFAAHPLRLSRKSLDLRVLVIPNDLHPHRPRHGRVVEAVARLIEACEAQEVEIIWEEEANRQYESLVSPGFWAWARRDKREMADA